MHYHLIGSMGISMSGISKLLKSQGHTVSGSDLKLNGHSADNINSDIDFVVRTSAVNPGSPGWVEVEKAEELGIPVLKRSELIKKITEGKKLVAISGMHGKTTVTTLIGLMLVEAGFDPTVLVGEKILEFGDQPVRIGNSEYFVLEACEYDRSFFDFYPDIAVITNLDVEHLDTYPNGMPDILEAFEKFISNINDDGHLVYCEQDENLKKLAEKFKNKIDIVGYGNNEKSLNNIDIKLIGKHNRLNSLAAIKVCELLKIDPSICAKVLENFSGARRRLEYKGSFGKALVYDDYGHHPTEIKAAIKALKDKYPEKALYVVFWPHQYKRIKPLLNDFSESFSGATKVILKEIFFVPGRDEMSDVSSSDISNLLYKENIDAEVIDDDNKIVETLQKIGKYDAVILTIGIPPVYLVADMLVKNN